jgi:hypothetical protein
MTLTPLLAAGWDDLIRLAPFIIALLVWVINRFASTAPKKPPQGKVVPGKPLAPPLAKQPNDPLQSEIDDFLRQAKSLREGKPTPARPAMAQGAGQRDSGQVAPAGQSSRQRPPILSPGKRTARRESTRPASRPAPPPVPIEAQPARESVADHVAQALDSRKFDRPAPQLNQSQQDSDAEFRQHMERVFQRDIGSLKPEPAGIFKDAAASAAAVTAAATAKAVSSAAGSESATAPETIHQGASDIALFLAGRKNIRDAVILSEILRRPEQQW